MLELKKDFVHRMTNCDWLCNCGQYDALTIDFPVQIEQNKKTVLRSVQSMDWRNTCQEREGDFTVFLHLNHRQEYNQFWNVIVKQIHETYKDEISVKIAKSLSQHDLPSEIQ